MGNSVYDALKEQRRLINFWESDEGRGFALALAEVTMYRNTPDTCPRLFIEAATNPSEADGTKLAVQLASDMRMASAFWTHRDMVALTQAAASARPNDPLHNDMLPNEHGFALFDVPAYFDLSGSAGGQPYLVNVSGFSWGQNSVNGKAGINVILYSNKGDRGDTLLTEIRQRHRYSPWSRTPPLLVVGSFFIPFGEEHLDDAFVHFVLTWFHLITQPIATEVRHKAPRPMENMLGKLRIDKTVSVITLRTRAPRKATDDEGMGPLREWSHRWIVDGFWRNQWYPSLGRHQRIYIHAYEKGPADKPLVFRKKVYAWRR